MISSSLAAFVALALPLVTPPAPDVRADEQTLQFANVGTDGPVLLEFLRGQIDCASRPEKIQGLIAKLGDDDFAVRERASEDLVALGRVALPQLLQAAKDHEGKDPEIVYRARKCGERVKAGTDSSIPAVMRLLAVRRPKGAVEVLLTYAPFADGDQVVDEIGNTLAALASEGQPEPALKAALRDARPVRRALAAEALARARAPEARDGVRALLKDEDPAVRRRVALTLARLNDKDAVPVLIELLAALPADQVWPVEDFLYEVAGADAPVASRGSSDEDRKKNRDGWQEWWKTHADKVDLAKLAEAGKQLGYTLLVLLDDNIIMEVDEKNKPRWTLRKVEFPLDAQMLPGDRILLAEQAGNKVTERNLKGEVLWSKEIFGPLMAQRLPNGNTFIATKTVLTEVNREGKTVFTHANPGGGEIMRAAKLPNGDIACVSDGHRLMRLSPEGRILSTFQVNVGTYGGRIDPLRNGHYLVAEKELDRVAEYDGTGKVVWEAKVSQPVAAVRLPNGHTLATSMDQNRAVELDRHGKEVWDYRHTTRVSRAFRR